MIEVVLSFMAQTDQGMILFSRLKDATSVRTTGFRAVAQLAPDWEAQHERDWRLPNDSAIAHSVFIIGHI